MVLGLYLFLVFEDTDSDRTKRRTRSAMVFLCVAAPLLKLSGIVVPATLAFLALWRGRVRLGAAFTASTLVSFALFSAYGFYYNGGVFAALLTAHHDRAQTFVHFWTLFTHLDIGHYSLFDPSVIVGLVGALFLAAEKRDTLGGVSFFTALFAFSFLFLYVAPWEAYGWYKYALYPLLAAGLGYVFASLYERRVVFLVLFLPLLSIMLQNSGILVEQADRRMMMILFYALTALPILARGRFMQFRSVYISLLIYLFFFEAMWAARVLGHWAVP
jgi:hypothetical protein